MLYYNGYIPESINEGIGLRAVVFFSGCIHKCAGCHSPQTWAANYGKPFDKKIQQRIEQDLKTNFLLSGLTLCGGDPFEFAEPVADWLKTLKKNLPELNVWAYSGYTYEELIADKSRKQLLELCDVLLDGRFEQEKRNVALRFIGSSNQRIIDVQKSLKQGQPISWQEEIG